MSSSVGGRKGRWVSRNTAASATTAFFTGRIRAGGAAGLR
jgi:hypothetical protein